MENNMRKRDVVALGELLIDFTESGLDDRGIKDFGANPGGAPCNVLAMLHNLGHEVTFIGKVGNDIFGKMLESMAASAGIDMSGLVKSDEYKTTLAFVANTETGERDFSFYRDNGADAMISVEDIKPELIREAKVFHFGTLSMTNSVCEEATKYAVGIAKEAGCMITFDPNYRAPLWESEEKAKEKIAWGLSACDVVKISDNEITLMTGETDYKKGAKLLMEKYDIPVVFATLGPDGSMAFYKDTEASAKGFINPATIETTGAGDTFCACAIGKLLKLHEGCAEWNKQNVFDGITSEGLKELLTYANAAASIITTRKGALCVMPTKEEVDKFLASK